MADLEGTGDSDVEMEGTELGIGHTSKADGSRTTSTDVLDPPEQTGNVPHTSSSFEIKPDPDEKHLQPTSSPADPTKMKSAPKKKGTAATKKASKKARRPKSKSKSMAASGKNGGGEGNENESSSDDETDNGPYCICRGPDDHRWMISCDVCEDWFHGECVNLAKETGEKLVERFVCPNCTDGKRHYTKYKKTCSLPGCKNPARLYTKTLKDRSVFCCNDHCDSWWATMIATLPTKAASKRAVEVLTQEDFMGLLSATVEKGGWKLGDKPFGNIEGLWSHGLPTRPGVLSEEEKSFLQTSAAERLALGNEIVQYKKMMQLLDWANSRRQAAIEAGKFTKDSCGYDWRLDTVSVRAQFAAWLDTPDGQAVFKAGKLEAPLPPPPPAAIDTTTTTTTTSTSVTDASSTAITTTAASGPSDPAIRGTCDKKRCKPHTGWYKLLMSAVRVLIKETATAAAGKLEAEEAMRQEAEARYERRQLENNWVEVLSEE